MDVPSVLRTRSFRRIVLAVLVGGASACADSAEDILTNLPLNPSDESLIVSIHAPDTEPELRAYAVQDGRIEPAWTLPYDLDSVFIVNGLAYDVPLEQLGLSTGMVETDPDYPFQRPIPEPARIFQNVLESGTLSGWQPQSELGSPLSEIELPKQCTVFNIMAAPLPGGVAATFIVELEGRVLVGNLNGEIYLAHPDGSFDRLAVEGVYYDGYVTDDETLYLGGLAGRITRARWISASDLQLEWVDEPSIPTSEAIWYIDGDPQSGRTEQFAALADGGVFQRDDSGAWTEAFRASSGPRELVWFRPGSIRTIFGDRLSLTSYENGQRGQDEVPENSIAGGISSTARIPGGRPLAGTIAGQVYREKPETALQNAWAFVPEEPPITGEIRDLHAYPDGFVFVRPFGMSQVVSDQFCLNSVDGEIGISFEEPASLGGRAKLTVAGDDVVAQGTQSGQGPVLFWFSPPM